jgi:flagellar hook protein FlgE
MFAAISGLKNHQIMLDVTSNDIANVNTIGYKSARTTFKDSLNQLQRGSSGAAGGTGGSNAAQVGLGTQLGSIDNLMTSGATQPTGNPLDVAITGSGFFRVAASTTVPPTASPGSVQYSRAGNFSTSAQGYLTTQDGMYVQGRSALGADTLLLVPPGSTDVSIGQTGEVTYVDAVTATRTSAGFLSLATFSNAAGLERTGSNRWLASANSGTPFVSTPNAQVGFTTAGAVEMSNVDLAQAFTTMITAQRGFQANSRIISTSDEMLQDLVNLKR